MILFTILLSIIAVIAAIAVIVSALIGGSLIVLFGDLLVFGAIAWVIVKLLKKKK